WSTSTDYARHLLTLNPAALAETVAAAGNHELGALSMINAPLAFPLNLQTAQVLVKPRLVLLGDAAHTIHPLAGQGVNLGFRDVIALAQTLAQRKQQSLGNIMLLRRYERARKTDMMAMRYLTDGLYQMFATEQPVMKKFRSWGLRFVDQQPWVKKRLIKQAMF
ncbi:MAG TPA: FAD-dependent monooxygenase, partial [Methylophilaceae bacterium]|nr:FAD-dependent monooxygenase [Methylophilaceae bacterium]